MSESLRVSGSEKTSIVFMVLIGVVVLAFIGGDIRKRERATPMERCAESCIKATHMASWSEANGCLCAEK